MTASVLPSWFLKGDAGLARKKQIDDVTKIQKERSAPRIWFPVDAEGDLVFVDGSELFYVWEHNLLVNGKWGNYVTCTKESWGTCPVCDSPDKSKDKKPSLTAYATCLDTRPYTRKDGMVVPFRKVMFPAKGTTIKKLSDMIKKYGTLSGLKIKFKRYDSKNPNCGEPIEIIEKVDDIAKNFSAESAVAYDYIKILAPMTREELASFGFHVEVVGPKEAPDEVEDKREVIDLLNKNL